MVSNFDGMLSGGRSERSNANDGVDGTVFNTRPDEDGVLIRSQQRPTIVWCESMDSDQPKKDRLWGSRLNRAQRLDRAAQYVIRVENAVEC